VVHWSEHLKMCSQKKIHPHLNLNKKSQVILLILNQFEVITTTSTDTLCVYFSGNKLWQKLDRTVKLSRKTKNPTADATVEVQRYLAEPNIGRLEDPLNYWQTQRHVYPNLYTLAVTFLCTPASSVPCERVFSKAGEVVSKKRNRLSPKSVEKILFLNKNQ